MPLTRESVVRGMNLFLLKDDPKAAPGAAAAGCISCHVDFGRAATYRFDDWGTINRPAERSRSSASELVISAMRFSMRRA